MLLLLWHGFATLSLKNLRSTKCRFAMDCKHASDSKTHYGIKKSHASQWTTFFKIATKTVENWRKWNRNNIIEYLDTGYIFSRQKVLYPREVPEKLYVGKSRDGWLFQYDVRFSVLNLWSWLMSSLMVTIRTLCKIHKWNHSLSCTVSLLNISLALILLLIFSHSFYFFLSLTHTHACTLTFFISFSRARICPPLKENQSRTKLKNMNEMKFFNGPSLVFC